MLKCSVCRTMVPYGEREQYILVRENGTLAWFWTLENLATKLRSEAGSLVNMAVAIKNEVPGDIIWRPTLDEGVPDEALQYQRLGVREMEQLAALLRD